MAAVELLNGFFLRARANGELALVTKLIDPNREEAAEVALKTLLHTYQGMRPYDFVRKLDGEPEPWPCRCGSLSYYRNVSKESGRYMMIPECRSCDRPPWWCVCDPRYYQEDILPTGEVVRPVETS